MLSPELFGIPRSYWRLARPKTLVILAAANDRSWARSKLAGPQARQPYRCLWVSRPAFAIPPNSHRHGGPVSRPTETKGMRSIAQDPDQIFRMTGYFEFSKRSNPYQDSEISSFRISRLS